jgi:hypothetical protein
VCNRCSRKWVGMLSTSCSNVRKKIRNESYRSCKMGDGPVWEETCLRLYRYGVKCESTGEGILFWHYLERGAPNHPCTFRKTQELWAKFTEVLVACSLFRPGSNPQQVQAWLRNCRRSHKRKVNGPSPSGQGEIPPLKTTLKKV